MPLRLRLPIPKESKNWLVLSLFSFSSKVVVSRERSAPDKVETWSSSSATARILLASAATVAGKTRKTERQKRTSDWICKTSLPPKKMLQKNERLWPRLCRGHSMFCKTVFFPHLKTCYGMAVPILQMFEMGTLLSAITAFFTRSSYINFSSWNHCKIRLVSPNRVRYSLIRFYWA